jgi:c-di-GMP-related signal transduction protein
MDRKDIKDMVEEYEDQVTFLAEKIESREEYEKMKDIIEDLPLTNELAHALLGNHEKYNRALATVKSIEQGDWDELQTLCSTLQTSDAELYVYYQAVRDQPINLFQLKQKVQFKREKLTAKGYISCPNSRRRILFVSIIF